MVIRDCAGGVVFCGDRILLLRNEKQEWVLPKGVVRGGEKPVKVAVSSVRQEAGVDGRILAPLGRTHYEFFSVSREVPVRNLVVWYLMESDGGNVVPCEEKGFFAGSFFPVQEAMETVTYSQDKALLMTAWQRYRELKA